MFHELLSRDREDGRAIGRLQGVGPEAYLDGTSQGTTPEDAQKDGGHIRGRSRIPLGLSWGLIMEDREAPPKRQSPLFDPRASEL